MNYRIDPKEFRALLDEGLSLKECALKLDKSLGSIYQAMHRYGLADQYVTDPRQTNPTALLDETPEAYYWAGYLAADGSFAYSNKLGTIGRLQFSLAEEDLPQLQEYANFVQHKGPRLSHVAFGNVQAFWTVVFCHSEIVPRLSAKFDLKPRKTYDPPISFPTRDISLFKAFLIGLIDGDGSIKQTDSGTCCGVISCHRSWLPYFQFLVDKFQSQLSGMHTRGSEYAQLCFSHIALRTLKAFIAERDLKVLDRKWNKVLDIPSKEETYQANLKQVGVLHKQGKTVKEIRAITGLSHTHTHRLIKRYNDTYIDPEEVA